MLSTDLAIDQVWRHREPCKACRGGHHHRYVIVGLPAENPQTVMVQELLLNEDHLRAGSAPLPRRVFGSYGKGGLELAGRWDGARVQPLLVEAIAA